jgi:TonB family protein
MAALAREPIRARADVAVLPSPPPAPDPSPPPAETAALESSEPPDAVPHEPVEPDALPPAAPVVSVPVHAGVARPTVSVGAFDRPPGGGVTRAGDRSAGVASAGFDNPMAAPAAGAAAGAVRAAGFDLVAAPPVRRAAPPERPQRIDTPVEILFKPTPAYTDAAKALKIEGAVVLEVEFGAAGDVRVLRVLDGLGHGLDEAAAHAAGQIRFKPARSAGSPVAFRTTVRIVFRLT